MAKRTEIENKYGDPINIRATKDVKAKLKSALTAHGAKQNDAMARLIELFVRAPFEVQQVLLGTAAPVFSDTVAEKSLEYLRDKAHRLPEFRDDDEKTARRPSRKVNVRSVD